ncbi:MAG: YiiX/YebB-like N1pC/P60 family cysteine hydrolase, partial [bacterium]
MYRQWVSYWHWVSALPGRLLARFILREIKGYRYFSVVDQSTLARCIQPCDVLLVEGNQWVSSAIKYLTQSTWSHSALYVGNIISPEETPGDPKVLIEADIEKGVIGVPLSAYSDFNVRICRPIGLTPEDKARVISYAMKNLGNAYDLKNVFDLARFLLPTPPVPVRFRRKLIALGSGDPTRAICSSLIASAFQSVHYPILPLSSSREAEEDLLEIRHHSLFTPSDFDLSPYFTIVKPTLESSFDFHKLRWRP